MKAELYKKDYFDTNKELINRLNLLLEESDEETYYKRFNDVYTIEFDYDKLTDYLNAKSGYLKSYTIEEILYPRYKYDEETDEYYIDYDNPNMINFYNDYKIAYYDNDINFDKIYTVGEIKELVESGKIVLLFNFLREDVMNDDMFMEDSSILNPFSKYPFSDLKSLDEKTRQLVMNIIHTLVTPERIKSDIISLKSKVKRLAL